MSRELQFWCLRQPFEEKTRNQSKTKEKIDSSEKEHLVTETPTWKQHFHYFFKQENHRWTQETVWQLQTRPFLIFYIRSLVCVLEAAHLVEYSLCSVGHLGTVDQLRLSNSQLARIRRSLPRFPSIGPPAWQCLGSLMERCCVHGEFGLDNLEAQFMLDLYTNPMFYGHSWGECQVIWSSTWFMALITGLAGFTLGCQNSRSSMAISTKYWPYVMNARLNTCQAVNLFPEMQLHICCEPCAWMLWFCAWMLWF